MARTCCGGATGGSTTSGCLCAVEAGDNVTVTGSGGAGSPYVINANVTVDGGSFDITDLPPSLGVVEYDAVDGWPPRGDLPVGWRWLCINQIDSTPPPSGGVDGYISGLDVALLAVTPIP